jgi:hypothetical protein
MHDTGVGRPHLPSHKWQLNLQKRREDLLRTGELQEVLYRFFDQPNKIITGLGIAHLKSSPVWECGRLTAARL